jgi:hypothetical protein
MNDYDWDDPDDNVDFLWDDVEPDYDKMTPTQGGQEFIELLLDLKTRGILRSNHVCQLAFFAATGGCVGGARDLGLSPGKQSGKYQSKLDKFLGIDLDTEWEWYKVPAPCYNKYDASRDVVDIDVLNVHELLNDELRLTPSLAEELRTHQCNLPLAYHEHPIQKSAAEPTYPIGVYLDGVRFGNRLNVLGLYVVNIISGVRHLCCVLPKHMICRCGCKGWCTLFPIFLWLHWCILALALNTFPTERHDGSIWLDSDDSRCLVAGEFMLLRACLLLIKGDWAEYAHTLGLPAWNVNPPRHACPICSALKLTWCDPGGFNVLECPCPNKTYNDYDVACQACEIVVIITSAAVHRQIRNALFYDKRTNTIVQGGRCLRIDLPDLNLNRGDRLEPTPTMVDIGNDFDMLCTFPVTCLFWRPTAETQTKHRNPIFAAELGTSPGQTLGVDWLHCLSLGVFKPYCSYTIHCLVAVNAWGLDNALTEESKTLLSLRQLCVELKAWYREEEKAGHNPTKIGELTPSMIGSADEFTLSTKGSETNHLLRFLAQYLLPKYGHKLENQLGDVLTTIGDNYCLMMVLIHRHHYIFPPSAVQANFPFLSPFPFPFP